MYKSGNAELWRSEGLLWKRPELQETAKILVQLKSMWEQLGTWGQAPMEEPSIAPHPNHGDKRDWMRRDTPRGPIGFLIQDLSTIGAYLTQDLVIHVGVYMPHGHHEGTVPSTSK